jgi:hypothetical protein
VASIYIFDLQFGQLEWEPIEVLLEQGEIMTLVSVPATTANQQ